MHGMTPQCDEECHAAGDDLGRDEEGGPRHHHEQPRGQVVDVQVPAKYIGDTYGQMVVDCCLGNLMIFHRDRQHNLLSPYSRVYMTPFSRIYS